MSCPECGCKEIYQYNGADFGADDEHLQRCAACGHIFDIEDSADEHHEESEPFSFGGDLGKTVHLVIKLEQVNAVQWSATSNHSGRIVRQADAHDALRLALTDAGAGSGEVPPVDCYIGWARFTERSMVFCDSDAPGAFRVYRARAALTKAAGDAQ